MTGSVMKAKLSFLVICFDMFPQAAFCSIINVASFTLMLIMFFFLMFCFHMSPHIVYAKKDDITNIALIFKNLFHELLQYVFLHQLFQENQHQILHIYMVLSLHELQIYVFSNHHYGKTYADKNCSQMDLCGFFF